MSSTVAPGAPLAVLPAASVAEMVTVMLPSAQAGEIGRAAAGDAGQHDGGAAAAGGEGDRRRGIRIEARYGVGDIGLLGVADEISSVNRDRRWSPLPSSAVGVPRWCGARSASPLPGLPEDRSIETLA